MTNDRSCASIARSARSKLPASVANSRAMLQSTNWLSGLPSKLALSRRNFLASRALSPVDLARSNSAAYELAELAAGFLLARFVRRSPFVRGGIGAAAMC